MYIFIRPAVREDSKNFAEWFLNSDLFAPDILAFPQTYTLCAFTKDKTVGFLIVEYNEEAQFLSRLVTNPEASWLEKAEAHQMLLKQVITIGFAQNLGEIYFVGSDPGTNRLSKRVFQEISHAEYGRYFAETTYPVYRLRLKDLENAFNQ